MKYPIIKSTAVAAAMAVSLAGCGGGSGGDPVAPADTTSVPGSITVVPSLGQITNAMVTVFKADGTTVLGSRDLTAAGQATINFADYSGPVLIEVVGNANAKYFDEAKGAEIDFPASEKIHAISPTSTGTIGVTMLTELAYQGAVKSNYFPLDAARITELNNRIRLATVPEIANLLTAPTTFNSETTAGSLPNNDSGKYALALAALAKLGNSQSAPALAMMRALGKDVEDGDFDGKGAGNVSVATPYSDFKNQLVAERGNLANTVGAADLITALPAFPALASTVTVGDIPAGNGGGSTNPNPSPTVASARYLPYGPNLSFIDTADSNFPVSTVTTGAERIVTKIPMWAFDTVSKKYTSAADAVAVFIEDNKLWKVDLRSPAGLAKTQVSSASFTDACDLGERERGFAVLYNGFLDPNGFRLLWQTRGPDGNCDTLADNRKFMVKLTDSGTAAPAEILSGTSVYHLTEAVYELSDPQNPVAGSAEILVNTDHGVTRYDSEFNNPTDIVGARRIEDVWGPLSSHVWGRRLSRPDGLLIGMADGLRWYQRGANSLSAVLKSGTVPYHFICDDVNCYGFERSYTASGSGGQSVSTSIFRLPADGSGPAQNFSAEIAGGISWSSLTNNYIYFVTGESVLFRIATDGPNAGHVERVANVYTGGVLEDGFVTGAGTHVYFTGVNETTGVRTPVVIAEDGTPVASFPGHTWAGTNLDVVAGHISEVPNIIAKRTSASPSAPSQLALKRFDSATNTVGITVGTLPNPVSSFTGNGIGNGKIVHGVAKVSYIDSVGATKSQTDIFALDLTQENSAKRITTTQDISEEVYE